VGVPLILFYYFAVMDRRKQILPSVQIAIFSVVLGTFSVGARVATHNLFDASVAQFENYIALDKQICAKGRSLLMNYYLDTGDSARGEAERAKWYAEVPEKSLFMRGIAIKDSNVLQALALFRRVTEMNPVWQDAWSNLGSCYLDLSRYDTAIVYLKIALGINPYDAGTWNNLAFAYMYTEDYAGAEKALRRSIALDNAAPEAHQNLITLYKDLYHQDELEDYLRQAASKQNTPIVVRKALVEHYLARAQHQDAAEAFRDAVPRGLDSAYIKVLLNKYPQLNEALK
jgi:tetratricopeptide (TPR) repeat protein